MGALRDRPVSVELRAALAQVVELASDADRHGHVDAPALVLAPWSWGT